MNSKSVFSDEYNLDNMTEPESPVQDEGSAREDKEERDIFKEYKLSKPRRNIIRARIIPK